MQKTLDDKKTGDKEIKVLECLPSRFTDGVGNEGFSLCERILGGENPSERDFKTWIVLG